MSSVVQSLAERVPLLLGAFSACMSLTCLHVPKSPLTHQSWRSVR